MKLRLSALRSLGLSREAEKLSLSFAKLGRACAARMLVIASVSEAIQGRLRKKLDCFVAALVIGGRTRWLLAMTKREAA